MFNSRFAAAILTAASLIAGGGMLRPALATAASPSPGVAITVDAPCLKKAELNQPRLDVQACSFVLRDTKNTPALGLLDQLDQRLRDRIKCYYKGVVPDLNRVDNKPDAVYTSTTDACKDGIPLAVDGIAKPVCSIADDEDTTNHNGQSCGDFRGVWEQAQLQGLWVQAVKKIRDDIDQEILNNNTLGVSARCQPIAQDYVAVSYTHPAVTPKPGSAPNAKTLSDHLTANTTNIPPEAYRGGINFCEDDAKLQSELANLLQNAPGGAVNAAAIVKSVSAIPKAATCALAGSREYRVNLFANLAECELWSRLDYFLALYADTESQKFGDIITECFNRATHAGHQKHSKSAGKKAGEAEFDSCYPPKAREFFKRIHQQYLPGKFNTRNIPHAPPADGSSGLLFALGSLLPVGNGRKKRNWKKIAKKTAVFFTLNSVILSFATYYSLGGCCSDDTDSPPLPVVVCTGESETTANYPTALTTQCCKPSPDQGLLRDEVQKDYGKCVACKGANCIANTQDLDKAGLAAYQAQLANAETAKYAGIAQAAITQAPSPTPTGNGDANFSKPDSVNATAGDTLAPKPNAAPGGPGAADSGSQGGGGAGPRGSAGAGAGGGSGFNPAGLKTAANVDAASGGALEAPTGASSKDGTYSGGGAGAQGAGNSAGGFGHGAGLSAEEGGGTAEANFTPDSGGLGTASAIDDPADYFTRIGLGDSLFKIVEKRYRTKAVKWISSEVQPVVKKP